MKREQLESLQRYNFYTCITPQQNVAYFRCEDVLALVDAEFKHDEDKSYRQLQEDIEALTKQLAEELERDVAAYQAESARYYMSMSADKNYKRNRALLTAIKALNEIMDSPFKSEATYTTINLATKSICAQWEESGE